MFLSTSVIIILIYTVKPIYSTDTLRDTTKRSLLRPELLHYSEGSTDNENRINRQTEQNDIFLMYPELLVSNNYQY